MITRFAPSPTGPLHLGHAYSALYAYDFARTHGGQFLLRIEDIDQSRSRVHWEQQIYDDLSWLGIDWEQPVMRQSDRMAAYTDALKMLTSKGLIYRCSCNRRDILDAISAPQEGSIPTGPDGVIYPGTCRRKNLELSEGNGSTLRLNMKKALSSVKDALTFEELLHQPGRHDIAPDTLINKVGDIVLARKDMGTSYHLSVVLDDAAQGITDVIRGEDLFEATQIHVLLQKLLGLPTPIYHHHRLIRDETGKRLAKRDDARAIAKYREDGLTPADIRQMVNLPLAS